MVKEVLREFEENILLCRSVSNTYIRHQNYEAWSLRAEDLPGDTYPWRRFRRLGLLCRRLAGRPHPVGLRTGMAVLCIRIDPSQQELPLQHWMVGVHVPDRRLRNEYVPAGEGASVRILLGARNGTSTYIIPKI